MNAIDPPPARHRRRWHSRSACIAIDHELNNSSACMKLEGLDLGHCCLHAHGASAWMRRSKVRSWLIVFMRS
jgi:hypothetical protein